MAQNPNIMNPTQTDPLAQLRDIHAPAAVEAWPPAIGWWILAALAVLAVVGLIAWLYVRWQRNRYRREALAQLELYFTDFETDGDLHAYLDRSSKLLKLTALTRYPRTSVAPLTGEAWVRFLDRSADTNEFSMGAGQVLISASYEPDPKVDVHDLHELAAYWIKQHGDLPVEAAA